MGKLIQAANRFAFKKLAWGVVVMVTAQVLGNLNQLKGVVPDRLITISTFVLGVFLSVGKGVRCSMTTAASWSAGIIRLTSPMA